MHTITANQIFVKRMDILFLSEVPGRPKPRGRAHVISYKATGAFGADELRSLRN